VVGLFRKKEAFCTICKKKIISHKHKPKREWNLEGSLCANCYVDFMKKYYNNNNDDKCTLCGSKPGSFSLMRPKKEWNLRGWLCQPCFDQKEKSDNELKKFCCLCGIKLGFISYTAKKEWNFTGELCKKCFNLQKTKESAI